HRLGLRYRLHAKELPGSPDLVFPKYKAVVFVHGCFWHQHSGCRRARKPTSRREWWDEKLQKNVSRDERKIAALNGYGWRALIVSECEVLGDAKMTAQDLAKEISSGSQ